MFFEEALEEIKRYKYISYNNIELPAPGESIYFDLIDAETNESSFLVIITRGSQTFDITLTQRWDFLCKYKDERTGIIVRFDYAGAEHFGAGSYHVHIGDEQSGGITIPMSDMEKYFLYDNEIIIDDAIFPRDEYDFDSNDNNYGMNKDDVVSAIKGFLIFISCDNSDVYRLNIEQ